MRPRPVERQPHERGSGDAGHRRRSQPGDVVVEEAPTARPLLAANLPTTQTSTYFAMDSGGLGFGMPAAVGIALARPGVRVFGLIGTAPACTRSRPSGAPSACACR